MIEKNELSNDNTTRREVSAIHLCHGNIFNLYFKCESLAIKEDMIVIKILRSMPSIEDLKRLQKGGVGVSYQALLYSLLYLYSQDNLNTNLRLSIIDNSENSIKILAMYKNLYLYTVEEHQRKIYQPEEHSFIFHYES